MMGFGGGFYGPECVEISDVAISQWMDKLSKMVGSARLGDFAEVERDSAGQVRPVYRYFALSCGLRGERAERYVEGAKMVGRGETVVEKAWGLWLGVLMGAEVDAMVRDLSGRQYGDGRMHALDAETNLDSFVFDELCTLHALGHAAIWTGRADLREMVLRGCRYHVENTQPDNSTNQPWALAAFAMNEETMSFAEQQVHDCYTHWVNRGARAGEGKSILVGLAADAVDALGRQGL